MKIAKSSMSRKMLINPKISSLKEIKTKKCSMCARERRVSLYKKISSTHPNKFSTSFTKKDVVIVVVGFR
jgi:hypothetical protein